MICRVEAAPIATMAPVVSSALTGAIPLVERKERTGLAKEIEGVQVNLVGKE